MCRWSPVSIYSHPSSRTFAHSTIFSVVVQLHQLLLHPLAQRYIDGNAYASNTDCAFGTVFWLSSVVVVFLDSLFCVCWDAVAYAFSQRHTLISFYNNNNDEQQQSLLCLELSDNLVHVNCRMANRCDDYSLDTLNWMQLPRAIVNVAESTFVSNWRVCEQYGFVSYI